MAVVVAVVVPVHVLAAVGLVGVIPLAAPRPLVAVVARPAGWTVMALSDVVPLVALRSVVTVMTVIADRSLVRDRIRRSSATLRAVVRDAVPAFIPAVGPATPWGRGSNRVRGRGAPGLRHDPQPVRHGERQCGDHQQDE
jgi:hypothetical protein